MEFFDALTDDHRAFIARQPVFFVATAAAGARINLSPKGMDSFRVLDAGRVAYLDVGGSGNETQRASCRRRAHHDHVLRVRQARADLPHLWPRPLRCCRRTTRLRATRTRSSRRCPARGRSSSSRSTGPDELRLGRAAMTFERERADAVQISRAASARRARSPNAGRTAQHRRPAGPRADRDAAARYVGRR